MNRLARERPAEVGALVEAAERLRAEQASGGGGFSEAVRAEQDHVRSLVRSAGDLLGEAGRRATDATLAKVGQTLQAAAASDEGRAALQAGTLERELEPAGFDVFAGALPAPKRARGKPTAAPKPDRKREERARLEEELKRAGAEARGLEREAKAARARADRARAEVERLEGKLRRL